MSQPDEPDDEALDPGLDERFADWVDGRLSYADQEELEAELDRDAALRDRAEGYRATVLALRRHLPAGEPPAGIVGSVMAALPAAAPRRTRLLPLIASLSAAAAAVLLYLVLDGYLSGPGSVEPDSTEETAIHFKDTVREKGPGEKAGLADPSATAAKAGELDSEKSRQDGLARKGELQDDRYAKPKAEGAGSEEYDRLLEKGGVKQAERPRSKDAPDGAARHGVAQQGAVQQGAVQQEIVEEEVEEEVEEKAKELQAVQDKKAEQVGRLALDKAGEALKRPIIAGKAAGKTAGDEAAAGREVDPSGPGARAQRGLTEEKKRDGQPAPGRAAEPAAESGPEQTLELLVRSELQPSGLRQPGKSGAGAPPAAGPTARTIAPVETVPVIVVTLADVPRPETRGKAAKAPAAEAPNAPNAPKRAGVGRVEPEALDFLGYYGQQRALSRSNVVPPDLAEVRPSQVPGPAAPAERDKRTEDEERRPARRARAANKETTKALEFVPGKNDRIYSVTGDEQQIRSVFQILRGYLEMQQKLASASRPDQGAGYSYVVQQTPKEMLELDKKLRKFAEGGDEFHLGQTRKSGRATRPLSFYLVLRGN